MNKWLIGADPEFFLKKGRSYVSAHDLLPGTKANPHPVRNGAIQVDGTAVEYNINPAKSCAQFVDYNQSILGQIRDMLPEKYTFCFRPHVNYSKDYFKKLPDVSKVLGCEPDLCTYTGKENRKPATNTTMRTAAGHIHIGWTKDKKHGDVGHALDCRAVVAALDETLLASSCIWDSDKKRRTMYGKAGSYRIKPYGVEYRSLSCAWLEHEDLMTFVYEATIFTLNRLKAGFRPEYFKVAGSAKYWSDETRRLMVTKKATTIASLGLKFPGYPMQPYQHMTKAFSKQLHQGGHVNG